MSTNEVNNAQRVHIGFFGCRNAGKSSLVNAFTGQKMSVVSDYAGTTTDPVTKAMELLPLGPVLIIDTPGYDDEGELGKMRVERTKEILLRTDVAVLCCDILCGIRKADEELIGIFREKKVPYIIAYTKLDLAKAEMKLSENEVCVSSVTGENINLLKEKAARLIPERSERLDIVNGFIKKGDIAILVTPIDSSAPKGRIILPQQHILRDILDNNAISVTVQPEELSLVLENIIKKPAAVICDSQVFKKVSDIVPPDIKLTSFSILMAKYKGMLDVCIEGVSQIKNLKDKSKVLISEGCTHHRQCEDIGSVKIPRWLRSFTKKELDFTIVPGHEFPDDLSEFSLVIHCGGCMINEREVKSRMEKALNAGVPFTNYGIVIAYMNNILKRSIEVFPNLSNQI